MLGNCDRLPRSCLLTPLGSGVLKLATEMEAETFAIERVVRAEQ